ARDRIPQLETELGDLADELTKTERNAGQIEDVVSDLKDEKSELQSDLDSVEHEIQSKQQEYAELDARANESGDSSFGRAVSTILNGGLDGVHGAVAQLGSVDQQYATACETAAGGRLAQVVVDDDSVGQRCIEYLKQRNAGRATFLPISKMNKRRLPSVPNTPGVVDFAYNLIDFDSQYASVFSYVVGGTLVVEDMETARDLMGDFRLVTLSGELVEKSGAMTGGSTSGSRYSFSASGKGKIERVARKINELEDERQSIRSSINDVEERLDDARDRQTDATDQVRTIENDIEQKESELESIEERIGSLQSEIDDLQEEREDVTARMEELDAEVTAHDETIADIEDDISELESELADSQIPELTSQADEVQAEIDSLSDRMDSLDGKLNELQLEKQYAEDAIDNLHDDVESAQNRKAEQEERIAEFEADIEEKEEILEAKREAVSELEEELSELKEERAEQKEELQEAKSERDSQQSKVEAVENRLESLQRSANRLEEEVADLREEVGEYDPEDVPDHDEVQENIDRLTRAMEALEPVNMLAIDEYDEVDDELDDLKERKATLVEERDGIRERIDSYEAQKKETFMEAFDAIDEHFQDIFTRLSAGSGELFLEDEDDPFDGGLTMKAQPADKPVQRLDAMSGGEKSLTALAFIFAIQRYNPAPFYALDEVDAFLDAVNAERVGEMVDELAGDAQFVVVSHRSAMLDRSERAIGVTMQGDNVSSVTGIRLDG
ncbi:chromosome segregation protein SMC, partial [Haladaptatus sp.]|uniref:chromosome segregation protein SMC n=1 Tax=Haladaptatus sp. TaxID=1973141 RepID=UPI003C685E17